MEEKDKYIPEEETPQTTEEIKRIRLKRHLWPDEIEDRRQKQKISRLKFGLVFFSVLALLVGWLFGSALPMPALRNLSNRARQTMTMDSSKKIDQAFDIMENDWYFGKDIENLDTRLIDSALDGMTAQEEDLHTDYMSAKEVTEFVQSINRDYVGIGVQYIKVGDLNVITRVFRNTPAEEAGVQAGDLIQTIDGEDAAPLTTDEIKERVIGEEGTTVTIVFGRQGEEITLTIERRQISASAFSKIVDNNVGYLNIYQFGNNTDSEIGTYLDDFKAHDVKKLIIDLRDNGGGYLDALEVIASRFLPEGTVVMQEEYRDGTMDDIKARKGMMDFSPIVILVNGDTASASEVFTLALMEQRDDVTVVGTRTYGKGTVQITRMFGDGSAIKFTKSRWLSPGGTWVNGEGIEPDVVVEDAEAIQHVYTEMDDDAVYTVDQVSDSVCDAQLMLDYLEYSLDRTDGYFSAATKEALQQFQNDHDLGGNGDLNKETYEALYSALIYDYSTSFVHDIQFNKAMEILND